MASFRNLSEAVKEGAFRQDLYYRLNVIQVAVPPLAHDWPGNVRELRNATRDTLRYKVKKFNLS